VIKRVRFQPGIVGEQIAGDMFAVSQSFSTALASKVSPVSSGAGTVTGNVRTSKSGAAF